MWIVVGQEQGVREKAGVVKEGWDDVGLDVLVGFGGEVEGEVVVGAVVVVVVLSKKKEGGRVCRCKGALMQVRQRRRCRWERAL